MDGSTPSSVESSDSAAPFLTSLEVSPATGFNPTTLSCLPSSDQAPFHPSTDVAPAHCFNPSTIPYFNSFPNGYPQPVNFSYFPPPSVNQWRTTDYQLFTSTRPAPYPNNNVLNLTTSSSLPESMRRRKARKLYTQAQVDILLREFRKHGYVSKEDRVRIGKMTGIPEEKIKIWYQNRRYKEKKEDGETTSSEGRKTQSPSDEEVKSSPKMGHYFPSTQQRETAWLPDLNSHVSNPFNHPSYSAPPFAFFPPHSIYHHPFATPPPHPQGYQDKSRADVSADLNANPYSGKSK